MILQGGSQGITTLTSVSSCLPISCQGTPWLNPIGQRDHWCDYTGQLSGQRATWGVDVERQIEDVWHCMWCWEIISPLLPHGPFSGYNETYLLGWLERIKWNRVYTALSTVPSTRVHLLFFFLGIWCANMVVPAAQDNTRPSQSYSLTCIILSFTELYLTVRGWALETAGKKFNKTGWMTKWVRSTLTATEAASREWPAAVCMSSRGEGEAGAGTSEMLRQASGLHWSAS